MDGYDETSSSSLVADAWQSPDAGEVDAPEEQEGGGSGGGVTK